MFLLRCIFVLIFVLCPNFAGVASENNLSKEYCPQTTFVKSSSFKDKIQTIFGGNLLLEKFAENEIKSAIKEFADGDFKVNVSSYTISDAKNGKFESVSVTGKNINISNVFISKFSAKSLCEYIYLDFEKKPFGFVEPMAVDFELEISEEDLNKTIHTSEFQKFTLALKHQSVKMNFFEFFNPRVSLGDDKINFSMAVRTFLGVFFTVNIESELRIVDDKIVTDNVNFSSANLKTKSKKMQYLLKIFDPINYVQKIFQEYNCKTSLKSVKIKDGKIIISGSAFFSQQ